MTQVLERFRSAVFGLGKVYGPYCSDGRVNGIYNWSARSFHDCQAVIGMIGTFLDDIKRKQIEDVLLVAKFNPPKNGPRCKNGHYYKDVGRRSDGKCAQCARDFDNKRYERGRMINGMLVQKVGEVQ